MAETCDARIEGREILIPPQPGVPVKVSEGEWNTALKRNPIETLAGPGNHFAASPDRNFFATESWYGRIPVVLRAFRRGESEAFWQDTISNDKHTTWTLANHANPSFSRDGTRMYDNKCVAPGKFFVFYVKLPQK